MALLVAVLAMYVGGSLGGRMSNSQSLVVAVHCPCRMTVLLCWIVTWSAVKATLQLASGM